MRSTLNAKQWSRLRAYVNGLDDEAKQKLLHRCQEWAKAVAKELSKVANGRDPQSAAREDNAVQPLDSELVSQIANWLRK